MSKLSDVTLQPEGIQQQLPLLLYSSETNRRGDDKLRTNLIEQLGGDVIQGLVGEPAVGSLGAVALLVEVLTGKRLWSRMKEMTSGPTEEPAASHMLTGRIWCM